jgi:predicted RNase H-like HicB family nuclease
MAQRFYRAIAFQNPGDGPDDGWDVIFPDFPGCISQGETAVEAMKNATEALALHVEGIIKEASKLPPESQLNEPDKEWILALPMQNPVHALLNIAVPGNSVRMDITMDRALVERLDSAASREGTTRSGFLAQAVREKLKRNREHA